MKSCLILLIAIASPGLAETGNLTIHMILHAIGEEHFDISPESGGIVLKSTFEYSDRGNKRTTTAELRMKSDYTPLRLEIKDRPEIVDVQNTPDLPSRYFSIAGSSPFAIQMTMMRYWSSHGKPAALPVVREKPGGDPLRIEAVGHDSIVVGGRSVPLDRYTVDNLMFGREILWMNRAGELAAAMTFAGGLPMEAVRSEYEPAFPQLYRSGVAQEMATWLQSAALCGPSVQVRSRLQVRAWWMPPERHRSKTQS